MEFEIKPEVSVLDGKHEGEITRVEYAKRGTPAYDYTDIFIKLDDCEVELKYGCPSNVSPASKLGKVLAAFTKLVPKEMVDPEKVLVGRRVSLMTLNEVKDEGTFARVVDGSLKPLPDAVEESKEVVVEKQQ